MQKVYIKLNYLLIGEITMQCNYLRDTTHCDNEIENECEAGPSRYITSPEDREEYCHGKKFASCPRFMASLIICQYESDE
jgi:hypothetical protein